MVTEAGEGVYVSLNEVPATHVADSIQNAPERLKILVEEIIARYQETDAKEKDWDWLVKVMTNLRDEPIHLW